MIQNTISIAGGVTRNPLIRLAQPVTVALSAGEHIAVVGPNGGGKSLLVDTLLGKYPLKEGSLVYDFSPSVTNTVYDNVKYIAFRDTYGAADANYYYQQRWNAHDQEDAPEVREMLGEIKDEVLKQELFELFRIEPMLDKKIILLSSGELRKFQLTKALLTSHGYLLWIILLSDWMHLRVNCFSVCSNVLRSCRLYRSFSYYQCWTMCLRL